MACDSTLPSKADLQKLKRQAEFIAQVGTGRDANDQNVSTVTNPDTGETVITVRGWADQFDDLYDSNETRFDTLFADTQNEANDAIDTYRRINAGDYSSGPLLLDDKFTYATYNGDRFYAVSPPYTTNPVTFPDPNTDANLILLDLPDEQFVRTVANQTAEQILDGEIFPEDYDQALPLGAQSTVVPAGVTILRVNTGLKIEMLHLWEVSGDFASLSHTVSDVSYSTLYDHYIVTTNNGVYEFCTTDNINLRTQGIANGFGAAVNTNSTAQCQKSADETGLCLLLANTKSNPYLIDTLETTRGSVFNSFSGVAYIQATEPSVLNEPLCRIQHDNSYWGWNLKIDMNNTSRSGVVVTNSVDECETYVDGENVSADAFGSNTTALLSVFICEGLRFNARGKNISNTGHPNESVPRTVSLQDGTDNFTCGFVKSTNCQGATILANECKGTIGLIDAENCSDNGIYAGGSSQVHVGTIHYRGVEEALVAIANSELTVNDLYVTSEAGYAVNVGDHKNCHVGNLYIVEDENGNSAAGIARTRTNSTSSGNLTIGNIHGTLSGERLFAFDTGVLESLVIDNMNLTFRYDSLKIGDLTFWARFTACKEVQISEMNVKVLTPGFGSSTIFWLQGFGNLSKVSKFNNLKVSFVLSSDGETEDPSGFFRGAICQPFIAQKEGCKIRANLSPGFVAELRGGSTFQPGLLQAPTQGYFHEGEDYPLLSATSPPFRIRITATGSPPAFVAY